MTGSTQKSPHACCMRAFLGEVNVYGLSVTLLVTFNGPPWRDRKRGPAVFQHPGLGQGYRLRHFSKRFHVNRAPTRPGCHGLTRGCPCICTGKQSLACATPRNLLTNTCNATKGNSNIISCTITVKLCLGTGAHVSTFLRPYRRLEASEAFPFSLQAFQLPWPRSSASARPHWLRSEGHNERPWWDRSRPLP